MKKTRHHSLVLAPLLFLVSQELCAYTFTVPESKWYGDAGPAVEISLLPCMNPALPTFSDRLYGFQCYSDRPTTIEITPLPLSQAARENHRPPIIPEGNVHASFFGPADLRTTFTLCKSSCQNPEHIVEVFQGSSYTIPEIPFINLGHAASAHYELDVHFHVAIASTWWYYDDKDGDGELDTDKDGELVIYETSGSYENDFMMKDNKINRSVVVGIEPISNENRLIVSVRGMVDDRNYNEDEPIEGVKISPTIENDDRFVFPAVGVTDWNGEVIFHLLTNPDAFFSDEATSREVKRQGRTDTDVAGDTLRLETDLSPEVGEIEVPQADHAAEVIDIYYGSLVYKIDPLSNNTLRLNRGDRLYPGDKVFGERNLIGPEVINPGAILSFANGSTLDMPLTDHLGRLITVEINPDGSTTQGIKPLTI